MIAIAPPPEPASFDDDVRQPGRAWLEAHAAEVEAGTRPHPYWRRVLEELAQGFHRRCAYSATAIPTGTVDHFVSVRESPVLACEWANYRYADAWVNSTKGRLEAASLLDSFDVVDGWFEMLLPSCQVVVTRQCPVPLRARAELTLERLHLRDGEQFVRYRSAWFAEYLRSDAPDAVLALLEWRMPLLARALRAATPEALETWRAAVTG